MKALNWLFVMIEGSFIAMSLRAYEKRDLRAALFWLVFGYVITDWITSIISIIVEH